MIPSGYRLLNESDNNKYFGEYFDVEVFIDTSAVPLQFLKDYVTNYGDIHLTQWLWATEGGSGFTINCDILPNTIYNEEDGWINLENGNYMTFPTAVTASYFEAIGAWNNFLYIRDSKVLVSKGKLHEIANGFRTATKTYEAKYTLDEIIEILPTLTNQTEPFTMRVINYTSSELSIVVPGIKKYTVPVVSNGDEANRPTIINHYGVVIWKNVSGVTLDSSETNLLKTVSSSTTYLIQQLNNSSSETIRFK